jgi:hypothetical protein
MNSVPALYERYINNSQPAVDEWTLSLAMTADTANGGLNQLEDHYNTFIVCLNCTTISHCWLNCSIDRERFCGDRRRWSELRPNSNWLLGNRDS